jgi:PAS domain S-box-containing protein
VGDRYLRLFEDLPVGMFAFSGETGTLDVNPALGSMFGFTTPALMISRPPGDFLLARVERQRLMVLLRADNSVTNFVSRASREDGRTLWLSVDARAVFSGKRLERLDGVVRDITAQVQAARELCATRIRLARARESAASRARYQATVIEIGALALSGNDPGQLLDEALSAMAAVVGVPLAAAFEVYPDQGTATISAVVDDSGTAAAVGTTFPLAALTTYQAVLDSGGAVAVEDYAIESEHRRTPMMIDLAVRASLSALIPGGQRPLGAISLFSRLPRIWTVDEKEFVQLMAGMMSTALQRSRAEEQKGLLLARLVDAQESERRSIANEIHDDAVQVMTAASLRLDILRRQLGEHPASVMAERLQETMSLSIRRLRRLLFDLSPPALERAGLRAAVELALEQLRDDSGVEVEVTGTLAEEPGIAQQRTLYRVFQEALTNVRKHAQASRVVAQLDDSGGGVTLVVTDDGVGFVRADVEIPKPGHLGIPAMHERLELAGGWARVTTSPGEGTEVRLWLPT